MSWTNKYWDIVNHLYWWPPYIGMRSISQKKWKKSDGFICVPEEMVNKSGPLYTRKRKFDELEHHLNGNEEILNHIFDLTFAIAADSVLNEIILRPLGIEDSGHFESIGREISERYVWDGNVTQQDALFVSKNSAVAVELKLKSKSWPEQIMKYAAILTWEEIFHGHRENLGLLFIVPEMTVKNLWKSCGLEGPFIDRSFLDTKINRKLPSAINELLDKNFEKMASVLDRLKLNVISWEEFLKNLVSFNKTLDKNHQGDQTLSKLLSGLIHQLSLHRDTGIKNYYVNT